MADYISNPDGKGPAGGWGSLKSIARIYGESEPPAAFLETLARQNKPGGFMCVSCAWPKPKNYHPFEFCENGAKATMWELTNARCTPDFACIVRYGCPYRGKVPAGIRRRWFGHHGFLL